VRRAVQAAVDLKLTHLTIYSFSSENWSRPADEVFELMSLMKRFIRQDLAELHQKNVRILIIGERTNVDPELMALIDEARELTALNTALTLVIAFNY
ncbi:undecaprenyl diphosphate synthase family protein, partial [Streptococcus suis]